MMTSREAIDSVLKSVESVELSGDDELIEVLLSTATVIAGVALLRLAPSERAHVLSGIEADIANFIHQVSMRRSIRANGNGSIAMHSPITDG
jgi:hypothetical protein